MNAQDFLELNNLVGKLSLAANNTAKADGSFRRYNSQSMEALRSFQNHLSQLEHSLKTASLQAQPQQGLVVTEATPSSQRN